MLWESSKNQFGRPKKKKKGRQNFGKFFENPPPPRENPRSAPDYRFFVSLILRFFLLRGSGLRNGLFYSFLSNAGKFFGSNLGRTSVVEKEPLSEKTATVIPP